MNTVSRFKPLDHLPLAPGVCFICKGGIGPFIDTSLTVDFEGAIYICIGCIKEMFSQLGLTSIINEEEVNRLIAQARVEGQEQGELVMMGLFSEFVSNYADRASGNPADGLSESDHNLLAVPNGVPEDEPKQHESVKQGDGAISLQEPGSISGDSNDGDRSGPIFNFN